jgi:hypothetical protein
MVENARGGEAEYGRRPGRSRKSGTRSTKERSLTELRFVSFRVREKIIKDGRHVGLDFHDLLIEALMDGADPPLPGCYTRIKRLDRLVGTIRSAYGRPSHDAPKTV